MVLRVLLPVFCLSLVLFAQQVGLAQSRYSGVEFDDSWRLVGEERREPRVGRCRHDRYRDSYRRTSNGLSAGDDWSRSKATTSYTEARRLAVPPRSTTTTSTRYPVSTLNSSQTLSRSGATTEIRRPSHDARSYGTPSYAPSYTSSAYNVAPRAPATTQYRAPVRYAPPVQYRAPVQYSSTVPTMATQTPAVYGNAATWSRYDGARSYPVTTAGYRSVPTASNPYYYGTSIYGSPMIYAKDQPIRNWLRSLLP